METAGITESNKSMDDTVFGDVKQKAYTGKSATHEIRMKFTYDFKTIRVTHEIHMEALHFLYGNHINYIGGVNHMYLCF